MAENKKLWKCGINNEGSSVQFSLFSTSSTDLNTELRAGCALYYDLADNSVKELEELGLTSGEAKAKAQDRVKWGVVWLRPYVPAEMKRLNEWVREGEGEGSDKVALLEGRLLLSARLFTL